jgi:hypothetical protein
MSSVDLKAHRRGAETVRGQRIELAWAGVRAITVAIFRALDFPLDHSHSFRY